MRECGQERQTESAREREQEGWQRREETWGWGRERENGRTREGVGTMRERFNQTNAYK